jgi:hypothetical protein
MARPAQPRIHQGMSTMTAAAGRAVQAFCPHCTPDATADRIFRDHCGEPMRVVASRVAASPMAAPAVPGAKHVRTVARHSSTTGSARSAAGSGSRRMRPARAWHRESLRRGYSIGVDLVKTLIELAIPVWPRLPQTGRHTWNIREL